MNRGDRVLGNGRKVHRAYECQEYYPRAMTFCGYQADRQAREDTRKPPCKVCERAWQKAQAK